MYLYLFLQCCVDNYPQFTPYIYNGNLSYDAVDNYEFTALHYAVFLGHEEIVRKLIGFNANVNAQDSNGDTPLHWLMRTQLCTIPENTREIIAKVLLKAGANISLLNYDFEPIYNQEQLLHYKTEPQSNFVCIDSNEAQRTLNEQNGALIKPSYFSYFWQITGQMTTQKATQMAAQVTSRVKDEIGRQISSFFPVVPSAKTHHQPTNVDAGNNIGSSSADNTQEHSSTATRNALNRP